MNFPDHLKYTKDHIWIKPDAGETIIGITFFAQLELGDIAYVEVKTAGKHLEKGQVFGTIEAVNSVSDMHLPVSGVVKELNPLLVKERSYPFLIFNKVKKSKIHPAIKHNPPRGVIGPIHLYPG